MLTLITVGPVLTIKGPEVEVKAKHDELVLEGAESVMEVMETRRPGVYLAVVENLDYPPWEDAKTSQISR